MSNHRQKPFAFGTELQLVVLTGLKARNLSELRQLLTCVPESSIFFHTHQEYLAHNFKKPMHYTDFSAWVSQTLREEALAEKISSIDLLAFTSVRQLRDAIVKTVDDCEATIANPDYNCRPDEALHFCYSKSFILPTRIIAHNVPDFFEKLTLVPIASIYFHFFEARFRFGRQTNDFSRWLKSCGREDLAKSVDVLNPYIKTLDGLKQDIINIGHRVINEQ